MKRTLAAIFATISAFLIASALATYWIGDQTIRLSQEIILLRGTADLVNTTLLTIKDAETRQRGYLLSRDEKYLVEGDH
jgi:CHASE3 domain sensor protein